MRNRSRAFTLIELLIVIAIIGILAGILIPIISAILEKNRIALTRTLVMQCQQACEQYHEDYNVYPWCKSALVKQHMQAGQSDAVAIRTIDVFRELRGQGALNKMEDYLRGLDSKTIRDLGDGKTLSDGWGREIIFRIDPDDMQPVVYSRGSNGRDETGDGVTTDPIALPASYYLFKKDGESDDVPSR